MGASGKRVVLVGGGGEFGRFLSGEILPRLGLSGPGIVERDTGEEERAALLRGARHVVLATPLAGYPETAASLAAELAGGSGGTPRPVTLWLIPSVHLPTLEAVLPALSRPGPGRAVTAVLAHPMYGPHGFTSTEREARTFRNFVTAVLAPGRGRAAVEVARLAAASERLLGIATTRTIDPAAHDRITAASQGLSYCVAEAIFRDDALRREVALALPDLLAAFLADRALIEAFVRANASTREVRAAFGAEHFAATERGATGLKATLAAFAAADRRLNPDGSPIPTKWYQRLRQAAGERYG